MSNSNFQQTNANYTVLQNDHEGFLKIAQFVALSSGIALHNSPKNRSLVASRLCKYMSEHNIPDYQVLVDFLKDSQIDVKQSVIELLTTNKTGFFREETHFNFLTSVMPNLIKEKKARGDRELRAWCSASSTGQEPYSLLFSYLVSELPSNILPIKILATDINHSVLKKAKLGSYPSEQLQDMNPLIVERFFKREKERFIVKDEYRKMISFAPFNLANPSHYSFENKFDLIFCRNVLYYFDDQTALNVIHSLVKHLHSNGYLILGLSESGYGISDQLSLISNSVYQKKALSDET